MWGVQEVMNYTGMSRKAVIRLLNTKGCPVMPRKKKEKFRVPREAFIKWIEGGSYDEK